MNSEWINGFLKDFCFLEMVTNSIVEETGVFRETTNFGKQINKTLLHFDLLEFGFKPR